MAVRTPQAKKREWTKVIELMNANMAETLEVLTNLAAAVDRVLKSTSSRKQRKRAERKHRLEVEIQLKEEELQKLKRRSKPANDNESDMDLKQVP